jgi:aspartate-semialdehyde dehydrogenase
MALSALGQAATITRVTASTYQAVTGTGAAALQELRDQTKAIVNGDETVVDVYPHQIAMNVLPHVDDFFDDGYTGEERKMINETRKILHMPDLPVATTCVRVPVPVGHSESVHVEFDGPVDPTEARRLLAAFPGITLVDEPDANLYPMPHTAAGIDDIEVGRVRKDISTENGLVFWLSSDNLRKGAALNALQIMDEVVNRGKLGASAATAAG